MRKKEKLGKLWVVGVAQIIFNIKDRLKEIKLAELAKKQKMGGFKKMPAH